MNKQMNKQKEQEVGQLPDGTSTEHRGDLTSFNVWMTVLKGSRMLPLKLNPKIASTIKLQCDLY